MLQMNVIATILYFIEFRVGSCYGMARWLMPMAAVQQLQTEVGHQVPPVSKAVIPFIDPLKSVQQTPVSDTPTSITTVGQQTLTSYSSLTSSIDPLRSSSSSYIRITTAYIDGLEVPCERCHMINQLYM